MAASPLMSTTQFSAVVLAAGRSTRMGRDKALLEFDGVVFWRWQRNTLAVAGAAEIFLSARPDQIWARDALEFSAILPDIIPDCGPLGGIATALERAAHPHLAVLAIDLPRVPPVWFAELRAACEPGRGAVGRRGKFFEPLAAIYPREILPLVRDALAHGELSLQRLLAAAIAAGMMHVREIPPAHAPLFENWNEPRRG